MTVYFEFKRNDPGIQQLSELLDSNEVPNKVNVTSRGTSVSVENANLKKLKSLTNHRMRITK